MPKPSTYTLRAWVRLAMKASKVSAWLMSRVVARLLLALWICSCRPNSPPGRWASSLRSLSTGETICCRVLTSSAFMPL
ncbi:hypothetical protein D3C76_1602900 [compost metagenome]